MSDLEALMKPAAGVINQDLKAIGLSYEPGKTNLDALNSDLSEISSEGTIKLVKDRLMIVRDLERGGVPQVNATLSILLEQFKKSDSDERKSPMLNINTILLEAINLFPHLAKSISVTISDQYIQDSDPDRNQFARNWTNLDRVKTIILPLPYTFSTGTHGSGERKAANASCLTVEAREIYNSSGPSEPGLGIEQFEGLFTPTLEDIPARYIDSISFTDSQPFTPYLRKRGAEKAPRPHYIQHYLFYRGFQAFDPWLFPKHLSDKERASLASLTSASNYSLWDKTETAWIFSPFVSRYRLQLGFIAYPGESAEDASLYEFGDINVGEDDHKSAVKLALELKKNKVIPKKTYKDEEIIERLAYIPPFRRF